MSNRLNFQFDDRQTKARERMAVERGTNIAQWVLLLFGGVYILAFAAAFLLFWRTDATFEKGADLIKFMIQSLLPLATLAVGYYLGDKSRQQQTTGRKR